MVCQQCADAAAKKKGRKAHCNNGEVGPRCDCQHRVPDVGEGDD